MCLPVRYLGVLLGAALLSCLPTGADAPLRVGLVVFPGYDPAFLARDHGLFRRDEVQLHDYLSPSDALRAFRNGSLDVVGFTLDLALEAALTNPDTRVVLTPDVSAGADALVGGPEVTSLGQLRNRRVGLEASSLGVQMLSRALDRAGLQWEDVIKVPIDVPDQEEALSTGRVDAVVTYDPTRSRLLSLGYHLLFSSADIDGEVVDVLVTSRAVIEKKPGQLQRFLDGWLEGVRLLSDAPEDAAQRVAAREGLSADAYLRSLAGVRLHDREANRRLLGGSPPPLAATARRVMALMVRRGLLEREFSVDSLFDARFVLAEPSR